MLPDREIHIVDSLSASMAIGLLARMGLELAEADVPAAEIAHELEERAQDLRIYFALETLEYLKKGGRISGTQAAIGSLLSVKPVIMVRHGEVTTVDKVRTRSKARDRLIELTVEKPVERIAILHSVTPDIDAFRAELLTHLPDIDPNAVSIELVGPSVGPHVGPGCVGAAILYRPS